MKLARLSLAAILGTGLLAFAQPEEKKPRPTKAPPDRVITAHTGKVNSVQFSPNGRFIASGGDDKTLRIWDVATGHELFRSSPLPGPVKDVGFNPEGDQVISCASAERETLVVWDLATGRPIRGGGIRGWAMDFSLAPTAKSVVVRHTTANPKAGIDLLNVELAKFTVMNRIVQKKTEFAHDVALVGDRPQMLLAGNDNRMRLAPTNGGLAIRKYEGHTAPLTAVAADAAGKYAISGSEDKSARIWEVSKAAAIHVLKAHDDKITHVAMAENGSCAASVDADGLVRVWEPATGAARCSFLANAGGRVQSIDIAADGDFAVTGHPNGEICIWNLRNNGWLLRRCVAPPGEIQRLVWIEKDRRFVTVGTIRHTLYLWNGPKDKSPALTFEGHTGRVVSMVVTKDLKWLISAGDDRSIRSWDLATGRQVGRLGDGERAVQQMAITDDQTKLLTAHPDGSIGVWNMETGAKLTRLEGHSASIAKLQIATGSKLLITLDVRHQVRIWDLVAGREIQKFELGFEPGDVTLSPSGERFFVAQPGQLLTGQFYSVKTGAVVDDKELRTSTDAWTRMRYLGAPEPTSGGSSGSSSTTTYGYGTTIIEYYEIP